MKLMSLLLSFSVLSTAMAQSSNSCKSLQGYWVDYASNEGEKLKSSLRALEAMQNNPCRTIVDELSQLTKSMIDSGLNSVDKKNLETPSKLRNDLEMAALSPDKKVQEGVVKGTLASQSSVQQNLTDNIASSSFQRGRQFIAKNSKSIADVASQMASHEAASCLNSQNAAEQAVKILGSMASIVSAFNGSGIGEIGNVTEAASSLIKALSNKNIQKAMATLEATKMMAQLSCVVESTVTNYCEIQDAFDFYHTMNQHSSKISVLNKKYEKINISQSGPLDSYYILHRDLPNIISYIIKTKMVNVPYSDAEASTQNEYALVLNTFYSRIRLNNGAFQTKKREIFSDGCDDTCKKKIIANMVVNLSLNLMGGDNNYKEDAGVRVNFFQQQFDKVTLPFVILGKEAPPVVTGQFNGPTWTDPTTQIVYTKERLIEPLAFLRSGGVGNTPHPYLNDPLVLINQIGLNLDGMYDKVIARATNFELENLVGDKTNLVTRLTSNSKTSVHGSFRNIRNYLKNFKTKVEEKLNASGASAIVDKLNNKVIVVQADLSANGETTIPVAVKNKLTKSQFDLAIALRDINELLSKLNPILNAMNKYAQGEVSANDVLFEMYNKLLISVNGANYLPNRIETLAQVELRMTLRDDQSFLRDNFKDWFLASDQTLYSFMLPTVLDDETSAATRESQFNMAIGYAESNLSALELAYSDWLFAYIVALRAADVSIEKSDSAMSETYSPANKALREYTTASLDYKLAEGNKESAAKLAKLKAIKDQKAKNWINLSVSKVLPNVSMSQYMLEKISYLWSTTAKNGKEIKLKNLKENINRGSFKYLADRLCIQALAFIDSDKEKVRYDFYCKDAKLSSTDVDEMEKQKIITPDVIKNRKLRVSYDKLSRSTSPKDRICAFRDYFRSNDALQKLMTTLEQDDSDLNDEEL